MSVAPRPGSDAPTDRRTAAAGDPLAGAGFEDAPVALAITDSTGNWVRVNRMLCELLGHTAEELLGTSYRALTLPEDLAADDAATEAMLAAGGRGEPVEKRLRHADGRLLWVRVTATLLHDAEGLPWGAVAGIEDIDARRLRDAELARLALHDPLTGVRNRALLDDDIDAALQARDRDGGVVAVCYLDVDPSRTSTTGTGTRPATSCSSFSPPGRGMCAGRPTPWPASAATSSRSSRTCPTPTPPSGCASGSSAPAQSRW